MNDRLDHLKRLYGQLDELVGRIGGRRFQLDQPRPMKKGTCGVYFFFEPGELRKETGRGPRVVRVGTHAVSKGSKATLWKRLRQHQGYVKKPGGNHRGSVFRLLIGRALIEVPEVDYRYWLLKKGVPKAERVAEKALEVEVSARLAEMSYVWVSVDDPAGKDSDRAVIERNAIALLSNRGKPALDPASATWLGRRSHRETVRESGLWNSRHVDDGYDPEFLDRLAGWIRGV